MLLRCAVWSGLSWYTRHIMEIVLPRFQFRFMKAQGNVIFPGNFHPVGTQRAAEQMVSRAARSSDAIVSAVSVSGRAAARRVRES